jgi:hypothetical protein
VAQLVKPPRYKREGRGFDSRLCHWHFSGRIMALGSSQPLVEKSTRNISCVGEGGCLRRPAPRADNLATLMCRLS